jgi:hypothetical protein
MVDKTNVMTIPGTLCSVEVPRIYRPLKPKIIDDPKLVEIDFYLIPHSVFPKALPDFQFTGFHKVLRTINNVVTIVPNKDILFTGYMCRSGLPMMPPKIRYDHLLCKLVREEQEEPILKVTAGVSINCKFIQDCPLNFKSHSEDDGPYLSSPLPLLKKDNTYRANFTLKVDSGTGYFDDIPVEQVNKRIADKMDKDLFKKFYFDVPHKDTPLFVSLFACVPLE